MKDIIQKKIENYYLIEEQKKKKAVILEGYPYWLTIDPANFCNLECPLCPTGQKRQSRPQKLLSLDLFKKILDILGIYLIHIDFCNWGEPLLNDDIFEMISYANKFNIHTKFDTNINIFDEKKAEKLVGAGLDKIILSIDGASQGNYSKYRKGGDFEKVLQNVRVLVDKKKKMKKDIPFIEWQFLVFKHNEHELEKAKKIASEIGVDEINFTPPYAGSLEWLTALEPFRSNHYDVIDDKVEFKKTPRNSICNWLWDGVTINSDGSVSPCCSVENADDDFFSYLPEEDFAAVWNSKKYVEARKHVISFNGEIRSDSENVCLKCEHCGWSNHMDIEYLVRKLEDERK